MSASDTSKAELRIGDVAKLAGTTPRTIRYYEEIGLLPASSARERGAHRTYAEEDVERLADLLRLKDLLGLSLEELKALVEAEDARASLRREWEGRSRSLGRRSRRSGRAARRRSGDAVAWRRSAFGSSSRLLRSRSKLGARSSSWATKIW